MGKNSKREYLLKVYSRYRAAGPEEKSRILDEFCKVCGYNRKYAIAKLNGPAPEKEPAGRKAPAHRKYRYSQAIISILAVVWAAAGYLCSVRLKAALPLWLPWLRERWRISEATEKRLLFMSARQMDRRLQARKRKVRNTIYGRTKPGTLLKHQIPIKTDHWDVRVPGFTEVDLVSHSGNSAAGEFAYSVNQTDILTTWVETRAVLGKSEKVVVDALDEMRQALPFRLGGIDSDNGSEFINNHLFRYCQKHEIQFTRGRPYKKDDNAHIEQKNWTHIRRLFGWQRYDSEELVEKMNALYRHELGWFMNLFTPSMKLQQKVRVGSKIKRIYGQPKTPLDRLMESGKGNPEAIRELLHVRESISPFELAKTIETKLFRIQQLASKSKGVRITNRVVKYHITNTEKSSNNSTTNIVTPKSKTSWHSIGSLLPANRQGLVSIAKASGRRNNNDRRGR